jgi:hypothetical protein
MPLHISQPNPSATLHIFSAENMTCHTHAFTFAIMALAFLTSAFLKT